MTGATIVGAGLSGAVIARALAEAGLAVTVYDTRNHVAGNCHTQRDAETGILVHKHGPHIFHTDDSEVWDHVRRFARFRPYRHSVRVVAQGRVYALPVNLHTINQFFDTTFSPDQARAHLASLADTDATPPANFEEQGLSLLGRALYEAFFKGYTAKQWGRDPRDLPASLLRRLPVRFTYDDNYFFHRFQGMPEQGYTSMVQAMLDHPLIDLRLGATFEPGAGHDGHLFWSGALDGFFGARLGRLAYRTLDFTEQRARGTIQGCAVMNYADADVPHTRICEHKFFAPWEDHAGTIAHVETSRDCGPLDTPYYPVRLAAEEALLARYVALAEGQPGVTFVGRLGTYRYLDMDVTIREALDTARTYLTRLGQGAAMPAFVHRPL